MSASLRNATATVGYSQTRSSELTFELIADPDYYGAASAIVNPTLVVRRWGTAPAQLELNEERVKPNTECRIGYEATESGTNLIVWLKLESKEPITVSLRKGER